MALEDYLTVYSARDWQELDEGTLRFAMVGLGWWTLEKAMPAVEDSAFCETTAVVSGDPEKAADVRDDNETVERALTYAEFTEGEATDAYDAVYVCTPNAFHKQYVEASAAHGKPVLCEKPLEASVERAEELVVAAQNADIPLMTAYRMQTDPDIRRMRELVQNGAIGEPVTVQGHITEVMLEFVSGEVDQWRVDPDRAGYGTSVMDLGIYPLNTARFVLDADPVAVQAMMNSRNEAFHQVPDEYATFNIKYEDGTLASCIASQNAQLSGQLRIIGTEGELTVRPAFLGQSPQRVTLRRGDQTTTIESGRRDIFGDEMTEEFDYFADRVLRDAEIHPDGEHGLLDMRALAAIYEAGATGERVAIA
jgi:xylose dehydrogenase (NAD/NADP)